MTFKKRVCGFTIENPGIILINLKLLVFGATLFAVGTSMAINPTVLDIIKLSKVEEHKIVYITCGAVGGFACLAGLLGLYALKEDSTSCFRKQIFLLVVLCFSEFGLGVASAVYQSEVDYSVNTNMEVHGKLLNHVTNALYSKVEQELKCCGATKGCSDWNQDTSANYGCECDPKVDFASNCRPPTGPQCISNMDFIFHQPCSVPIMKILYNNLQTISGLVWFMFATEVLGIYYTVLEKWKDN